MKYDIQTILKRYESGESLEFLFFWGHHGKPARVTKACLSQWFPAFEQWATVSKEIVVKGNLHKFAQNKDMLDFLKNTGDKIIVEASPYDTIWGIGMSELDNGVEDPHNWKGTNLLGFALMEVRDELMSLSL